MKRIGLKNGGVFQHCFQRINIPETERQSFFEWLKNANDTKNKGLYVNWTDTIFDSPSDIQKGQFEAALNYANAILKQTEVIKSLDLTDDKFMDILNSDIE